MDRTNAFTIYGETYVFDLEKVLEFIFNGNLSKPVEKEIIDSYDTDENGDISISQKVIREISAVQDSEYDSTRYDLIKTLIDNIINVNQTEVELLPIGNKIVFSTLIENKMIKKI